MVSGSYLVSTQFLLSTILLCTVSRCDDCLFFAQFVTIIPDSQVIII